jgi:hypothetical protein
MTAKQKIRFVQARVVRDHNGNVIETFKAGQVFTVGDGPKDMRADSATHWLNRAIAVEVTTGTPREENPAPAATRPEGADLTADIISKIDALDQGEDFTAGGVPSVPALTRALGYDISADDRDRAWLQYQEGQAPEN